MKRLNRTATYALLKMVNKLERKIRRLENRGVTILDLEIVQIDLINTIAMIHGIRNDDPVLDWFCDPIFHMIRGQINIDECVYQLTERFVELQKQNRPQEGMGIT